MTLRYEILELKEVAFHIKRDRSAKIDTVPEYANVPLEAPGMMARDAA